MRGEDLQGLVAAELAVPVDPRISAMAAAIAETYPGAAQAVLFYGSCLRTADLDGQMLDFYLIVSDYRAAYRARWMALANRLLPPNVFPFTYAGLAAKYAILSEADLSRLCRPEASSVSVWARFAQPSRLVWVASPQAAERTVASVAEAAPTLFALTLPTMTEPVGDDPMPVWRAAFALTYRAELRAERDDRSGMIVEADPDRYRRIGAATLRAVRPVPVPASREAALRRWHRLQRNGKWLTVARLMKASATFAGGIDYLAWKIRRHAGVPIEIRPWQRRFPILGALTLLPRLLRGGAVR
jgi:hypothetical protein